MDRTWLASVPTLKTQLDKFHISSKRQLRWPNKEGLLPFTENVMIPLLHLNAKELPQETDFSALNLRFTKNRKLNRLKEIEN